jgi:hypothetical protein
MVLLKIKSMIKLLNKWFPVGTRSILFGVHCWFIHPWFVAYCWWKLYGFPTDFRLWVAFFVHDLGYWGKKKMDDDEGETHPILGANIMHRLFDFSQPMRRLDAKEQYEVDELEEKIAAGKAWGYYSTGDTFWYREQVESFEWHDFCLYHSRFYAKKNNKPFSRLCVADKMVFIVEPYWFYILRATLSGEVNEYMEASLQKEGAKYAHENRSARTKKEWHNGLLQYMKTWVAKHKDGGEDTMTPDAQGNTLDLQ